MPKRLSLDEFAKNKGQGNFATIVVDLDTSSVLEVVDSHVSSDIITALSQQPQAMREQVEEVCVDMWGGFPKVIKEVFPNAKPVVDRFHVQKLINKALNKLRLFLGFKGLKYRWLLLKNQLDLTDEERAEIEDLLNRSPSLRIAYELKEEIRTIYESKLTVKQGYAAIAKWLKIARFFFGSAVSTLTNHLPEISNYFANRTTSGVTEGLNTRIKLILRQSYGFKNFNLMKEKILACLFKRSPLRCVHLNKI